MSGVNDMRVDECPDVTVAARDAGAQSLLVAAPPYSLPSEAELAAHVFKIEAAPAGDHVIQLPGQDGRGHV